MRKTSAYIGLLSTVVLFSGCQTSAGLWMKDNVHFVHRGNHRPQEPGLPKVNLTRGATSAIPTSDRTYEETLRLAKSMTAGDPSMRIAQVAATGSMQPYLGESSIVILERSAVDRIRVGSVISYTRAGSEFIHVVVARTEGGVVARGSSLATEELVPFDQITGTVMGVLYFDPETAPLNRDQIPLLLAASGVSIPSEAGTLRITGATMLTGTVPAPISVKNGAPSEYTVTLERDTSLGLTLGVPDDSSTPPANATIVWAPEVAGRTVKFQFYHQSAPETGQISVYATFRP